MVIIIWEWSQPKGTGQGEEQNMTEKRKHTSNNRPPVDQGPCDSKAQFQRTKMVNCASVDQR